MDGRQDAQGPTFTENIFLGKNRKDYLFKSKKCGKVQKKFAKEDKR